MSSSYVQFGGHGFWCPDAILEVYAYLVGAELRSPSLDSADDYGAELMEKAQAGLVGCLDLGLQSLSKKGLVLLERVSDSLLSRIEAEPSLLSACELNRLRLGGIFSRDVPASQFAALIRTLKELLHGRWNFGAEDEEALPSYWMK